MKKILLITLEYPPREGGVASYYSGIVQELKRRGYEVEVISGGSTSPMVIGEVEPLLYRWFWPRWLKGYFVVRKLICGGRTSDQTEVRSPDIIFVGQVLPLGTVAYLLRKKVPYIVFTHGMDVLTAQKSRRKKWIMKKVLENAKLVIANSEFTKSQMSGVKCQVLVVYPCPSISSDVKQEDVELLRRKLSLVGKKVLLTLGRVVERKGHDLVIKALPEIIKRMPEVVYVVAGDGPYLEKLQKLVASGFIPDKSGGQAPALQSTVRFVGSVSDNERPLYYALCDLFVMPSRQIGPDVEGFGLSFLEAAIFGKTSVGGQSGGVQEAILNDKTGALVDPNDSSAFARVVVQLLRDDTLRNELGQNAKARVVYEFTWEKQIEVLINKIDQNG